MSDQKEDMDEKPCQTASATTSSDNANSGPAAYVITAVALGLVLALSVSVGSCATSTAEFIAQNYAGDGALEGLDDLLGDVLGEEDGEAAPEDDGRQQISITQDEAFDLPLSLYDSTIDAELSAGSYAGAPASLVTMVRDFVKRDKDAATQVASQINAAARDSSAAPVALEQALSLAERAQDDLDAVDIDSVSTSQEVAGALEAAKESAQARWQAIAQEIELLKDDSIDLAKLSDVDKEILTNTTDAADCLTQALEAARNQ